MGNGKTALILAGGDPIPSSTLETIPRQRVVIAANSGLDQALRLGLAVDMVVGDIDSASPKARQQFASVPLEHHPVYKDSSDLDLALKVALRWGVERIIVMGGYGGRLDHLLINATLLASARWKPLSLCWYAGQALAYVVRDRVKFEGNRGETVSLIPLSQRVHGIRTDGLWWPLEQAELEIGTSFGLSNLIESSPVEIEVTEGVLMVVRPEYFPTD